MSSEEGKLTTPDGLPLYWKAWIPQGKPRAVVQVIHGYGEHINRYMNVVEELLPAGYALLGNDHRGHGQSGGRRGYVGSFQEFINDERRFRDEVVRRKFPETPYFILGHSMGSLIALNFAEQDQDRLNGLVLSGTGSLPGPDIPKALVIITKLMSRLMPKIHVKSPLPPEFISRDPDVVKAYVDDPLVFNVITPRLAEQMNTYTLIGAANAGMIKAPVLIQYGSLDSALSGEKELFEAIGATDKTIKCYAGLKHEVYNELPADRATVLSHLRSWLDAHV